MTDENIGRIDENTPVGRTFEMEGGRIARLHARSETGEIEMVLPHSPNAEATILGMSMEDWNESYSKDVFRFIDDQPSPVTQVIPVDPATGEVVETKSISDLDAGEIFIARQRLRAAEHDEADAAAVHKSKKKHREALQEQLNQLIDSVFAGPGPLFAGESGEPSDRNWRAQRLDGLGDFGPGLTDSILRALSENSPSLVTMGDLCDWQEAKGDFWVKDIKGIGPEAQAKIDEATTPFWAQLDTTNGDEDVDEADAGVEDVI